MLEAGGGGEVKGGGPTHESRKSKSRNKASRGLKFRVHVSRNFPK